MSKAILEFDLADPDDMHDFELANKAAKMSIALWDYSQWLRSQWKYEELSDEQYKKIEEAREKFYQCLEDNDLNLDNLVV